MARIPQETLEQILSATNIVDLVGRYVKLRRAGSNYVGLCPFHTEKSPSFNVSPSRNSYHCFGCGAGGNAFRFLMEHDGLQFMEAVKRLGDAAGIRIQEEVWDANAERDAKMRSALMKVQREIAAWFHQLLMRHPVADVARQYLKARGVSADVAKRWKLGFAPGQGGLLREWMEKHRFSEEVMIEAGILAMSEDEGGSSVYPRFRQRLMFPINNDQGEVIAFSGRLLDPNAKAAKYLNSPETPIFNKGRVLFGFDQSRRAILKSSQALVCEGQMDLITLFEAGFQNVVAPLGTAFSEAHARTLKRHADEVVLCFDSDNAGIKAAERAFRILAPVGLGVRMAALPQGEDPDSLIRGQGTEAFEALLGSAEEFLDYQLGLFDRRTKRGSRDRAAFVDLVAENIRFLENPVAQEEAIQQLALRLDVPVETIRARMRAGVRPRAYESRDQDGEPEKKVTGKQLLSRQSPGALMLCQMALADAQVLAWLRAEITAGFLDDVPGSSLLALVIGGDFDPLDDHSRGAFLASLEPDEEAAVTDLLFRPAPPGRMPEAQQALAGLRVIRLRGLRQRMQARLKDPDLSAEEAGVIQQQILSLHQELRSAELALRAPSDDVGTFAE